MGLAACQEGGKEANEVPQEWISGSAAVRGMYAHAIGCCRGLLPARGGAKSWRGSCIKAGQSRQSVELRLWRALRAYTRHYVQTGASLAVLSCVLCSRGARDINARMLTRCLSCVHFCACVSLCCFCVCRLRALQNEVESFHVGVGHRTHQKVKYLGMVLLLPLRPALHARCPHHQSPSSELFF